MTWEVGGPPGLSTDDMWSEDVELGSLLNSQSSPLISAPISDMACPHSRQGPLAWLLAGFRADLGWQITIECIQISKESKERAGNLYRALVHLALSNHPGEELTKAGQHLL